VNRVKSVNLENRGYGRCDDLLTVLEAETRSTIADWLRRVESQPDIIGVELSSAERSAHLPAMFRDLVVRLRNPLPLGTRALNSDAAPDHGLSRREQGYTPAMMVEESRMLQVSIFQTLHLNLRKLDADVLLEDVMAIADEVDSQLAQAMTSYVLEAEVDGSPIGDVPSPAELADSHGLVHRNVPKTALLETVRQVFRGGRSIHPVQVSKDAEPEDMVGARVRDRLTLKR
jgi:hypothetical protein